MRPFVRHSGFDPSGHCRVQIPQRSSLLPSRSVLSNRSEAPTAPPSFYEGVLPNRTGPALAGDPSRGAFFISQARALGDIDAEVGWAKML
jgi:hypothetical protein